MFWLGNEKNFWAFVDKFFFNQLIFIDFYFSLRVQVKIWLKALTKKVAKNDQFRIKPQTNNFKSPKRKLKSKDHRAMMPRVRTGTNVDIKSIKNLNPSIKSTDKSRRKNKKSRKIRKTSTRKPIRNLMMRILSSKMMLYPR